MIRRRETGLITLPEQVGTEHTVAHIRRHARVLTWPVLVLLLGVGAASFADHLLPEQWMRLVLWASVALGVMLFVVLPLVAWLTGRVTITSRRIIVTNGFFARSRREIPFVRVTDVTLRRTPIQAALGSGDIIISRGDETGVRVRDLPGAALVQAAMMQLVTTNAPTPVAPRPRDKATWAEDAFEGHRDELISA